MRKPKPQGNTKRLERLVARVGDIRPQEWKPEPQTLRLIEWAIAGQPETGSIPEGGAEILAGQRRADLFEAWKAVSRFGPSAAELFRQAYGFPEDLTEQPDGLVMNIPAPCFADGIAEMLLEQPSVVGHDALGFAITREQPEPHWATLEWPTVEEFRRYLYRHARNLLWVQMRREDREKAAVIRQQEFEEFSQRDIKKWLERRERKQDIKKCLNLVREMKPELSRYLRILEEAADLQTGVPDWAYVAKRYGVPVERIEGFLRTTILSKWEPELKRLWLGTILYFQDRQVIRCVRPDPQAPGRWRLEIGSGPPKGLGTKAVWKKS